jgi:thioredoxin 1
MRYAILFLVVSGVSLAEASEVEVCPIKRPTASTSVYERLAPAVSEDCVCLAECIHERNDCRRNYAMFFMANWCNPCKRLYAIVNSLRDQGYIVYVFNVDNSPKVVERVGIDSVPTFIVMDNGKEIARFAGLVTEERLKKVLRTRKDQEAAMPKLQGEKPRSSTSYRLW